MPPSAKPEEHEESPDERLQRIERERREKTWKRMESNLDAIFSRIKTVRQEQR